MQYALIAALDRERGIGKNGTLPWRLSEDLQYFHRISTGTPPPLKRNVSIMGRATWESIPEKRRPLKHRLNVVITTDPAYPVPDGVIRVGSLDAALAAVADRHDIHEIFVIGGGRVFSDAIGRPECTKLYLTEVDTVVGADAFFPEIPANFKEASRSEQHEEAGYRFQFVVYERT